MKKNTSNKFYPHKIRDVCCEELLRLIKNRDVLVQHYPKFRSFGIGLFFGDFCPMCGNPFPGRLHDLREEVIKEDRDIMLSGISTDEGEKKVLPKEFFTDEWWINREKYLNLPKANPPDDIDDIKYFEQTAGPKGDWGVMCCARMKVLLEPDKDCPQGLEGCIDVGLEYNEKTRQFNVLNMTQKDFVHREAFPKKFGRKKKLAQQIFYCPWCGKKFPKSLEKE